MADEELGKDIELDFTEGDLVFSVNNDFRIKEGQLNLIQAIKLRLLTQKNTFIKHPSYGSRLPELVGEPRTDDTLSLAILYAYDSLHQEPRISEIVDIAAEWVLNDDDNYQLQVNVNVKPITSDNILNIVVVV